jgi:two-component system, OmpR family, phosphate regulon response regulator PhoB
MPGHILIIEDEPDIAEVLRYGLGRAGFETQAALTGEEGLNASLDQVNPPSLILLDLLLPGMTGTEICRRLRSEPPTRSTPILIMTAKAMENEIDTSLRLGANDFIVKPFSIRDVVARVRSLLSISNSLDSTRSASLMIEERDAL